RGLPDRPGPDVAPRLTPGAGGLRDSPKSKVESTTADLAAGRAHFDLDLGLGTLDFRIEGRQIAIDGGRTVSAVVAYPEARRRGPPTAVILAHGAGSDMRHAFLSAVHEGLAAQGYVTMKFNFPYTEIGRRAPDPAAVLEGCYARVLDSV